MHLRVTDNGTILDPTRSLRGPLFCCLSWVRGDSCSFKRPPIGRADVRSIPRDLCGISRPSYIQTSDDFVHTTKEFHEWNAPSFHKHHKVAAAAR